MLVPICTSVEDLMGLQQVVECVPCLWQDDLTLQLCCDAAALQRAEVSADTALRLTL